MSWHEGINEEELGYLHLGKVTKIEVKGDVVSAHLRSAKKLTFQLKGFTDVPTKTAADVALDVSRGLVLYRVREQSRSHIPVLCSGPRQSTLLLRARHRHQR